MTTDTLVPKQLWQTIQPLLPPPPRRCGGRPRIDDRAALAGIVYQLQTGIPWRLLPARQLGCGSPITCWRRLRDWQRAGVGLCHGRMSCSAQTRATVLWLMPSSLASSREDQWVTPSASGGGVRVVARISARRSRRTVWGRPRRGRSAKPAVSPCRTWRLRQAITVGRETPSRSAISLLATPSAASSRILARWTSAAGAWAALAQRRKTAWSLGLMGKAAAEAGIRRHFHYPPTVKSPQRHTTRSAQHSTFTPRQTC
jgi:Putative transposase of IS4/5 family (DUF4096)